MMTMRFMGVQSLLWLFLDRRLRCVQRMSHVAGDWS